MSKELRSFYEQNPLLVSSPFGGVDSINRDLLLAVFERLGVDLHGRAVLDVGCGRGLVRETVEELGGRYTGVDFVVSGAGFPLAMGDAAALPIADAAFDAVLCFDAFEHFPNGAGAAEEFRRVLRPGGIFFLSVPNYSNTAGLVKRVCEGLGWYEKHTWAPFRQWQPQELELPVTGRRIRRLMRSAGFAGKRRMGHAAEVGLGLFPWIDHAKMPEAVKFRLQRLFHVVGPSVVRVWPGASLHQFWKFEID